jgi:hypothetical protein
MALLAEGHRASDGGGDPEVSLRRLVPGRDGRAASRVGGLRRAASGLPY